MGKDSGNRKSKESIPASPEESKAPAPVRKSEHGPMSTIKAQGGLEDPDNVFFGNIRSDLYVVEPDDARPRRIDRVAPPGKPEKDRQLNTLDRGEESRAGQLPDESGPGPLHPGRSKKDLKSEDENR